MNGRKSLNHLRVELLYVNGVLILDISFIIAWS